MDIDGLGTKVVEQLLEAGVINNPADLFSVTVDELLTLERFAEKSANKLVASIAASKSTTLNRFIYALGIPEVGEATALALANHFGSLEGLMAADETALTEIPDVGPVVATALEAFFREPLNLSLIHI